ncbi:helix-turn-helix transcriptional regulator [Actinokineospora terrae]|uniref:RNA polymerase sigma-70 factor, ECF subfamily n=1 Tax=Actinokineospora terrae TaxID=155974 RepID=A0A1H9MMX9_9PSEU|nr:sigma factor-like helix-turn-helix DNA-binding protein [Actinokineospora terrae]SER25064.1 RNA polymerase sigma-70 factor, ECF subfamily [Actinokineospora terrae]
MFGEHRTDPVVRDHLRQWNRPRPAEDAAARRRADIALCAYFREQKYQGPDWECFVHHLLAYGLGRTRMRLAARALLPGRSYSGPAGAPGDLDELASDIVLAGFALFVKKGLVESGWSPHGGASLATYFDGACKLVFKSQYTRWCERHRRDATVDIAGLDEVLADTSPHADSSDLLDRLLDILTEVETTIFLLISEGFSHTEIAAHLDLTPRAVEGRVTRARQKVEPFRDRRRRTP